MPLALQPGPSIYLLQIAAFCTQIAGHAYQAEETEDGSDTVIDGGVVIVSKLVEVVNEGGLKWE